MIYRLTSHQFLVTQVLAYDPAVEHPEPLSEPPARRRKLTGVRFQNSYAVCRRISRAMMIRWISEVPSPIVQSLESRQNFSGG